MIYEPPRQKVLNVNIFPRSMSLFGFGTKQKNTLNALLQSPMIEKILDDAEQVELTKRRQLIAELEALPAKHDEALVEARRAVEQAEAAARAAQRQLEDACSC